MGHIASGFIHCSGNALACSGQGFPPSVNVPLTSGPRTFNITAALFTGFPGLGPQSFAGAGTGGVGTGTVPTLLVTVTGQEVSRTVVPEPGTGLLVGLGLAALGVSGGAFGLRRRR